VTLLAVLTWTFVRLSFLCLGGGLGAIPEMQRQVTMVHHWLTAREFVDGYALSQITPGPAMLVTVFIGYRVAGIPGAVLSTAAMFVPTSLLTWFVADRWDRWRHRPWAAAAERALAPIGMGLMAGGVYTLGVSAVRDPLTAALAAGAALLLELRWFPAAAVILVAGVVAWFAGAH
jgi:chromate transporter